MRLKLDCKKTMNRSGLKDYARFEVIFKDIEQLEGKKCRVTGEIEIVEIKEVN